MNVTFRPSLEEHLEYISARQQKLHAGTSTNIAWRFLQ